MELPSARRIVLLVILVLGIYGALLPAWMAVRGRYAQLQASAATTTVLPVLGLKGSVDATTDHWVSLTYTLPYPRTGGFARCRQRILDFPDLPLAIAAAAGLTFLGWKRRVFVGLGALLLVAACHLALIGSTAFRMARLLGDSHLGPDQLEVLMPAAAEAATRFGNVSAILTLGFVGVLAVIATRQGPRAVSGPAALPPRR